jgi:hypothetical protein
LDKDSLTFFGPEPFLTCAVLRGSSAWFGGAEERRALT